MRSSEPRKNLLKLFCLTALALLALCAAAPAQEQAAKSAATVDAADDGQQCVPFTEALSKVGQVACIEGTVVNVYVTSKGVTFLDFCPDFHKCEFTVPVLPSTFRSLSHLKMLQGADIRITGKVHKRGQTAEITWQKDSQLLVAYNEPPSEPDKADKKKKKDKRTIDWPGPVRP